MHENDSSWNRHKSPRLQLYASLGIHKNLPMFLEKPPEEIIKTSRGNYKNVPMFFRKHRDVVF